ncbi:hypothetical protein SAMD00019534_018900 [Acytostelium subglobosum LB1]|uniref:hypothetical protein n=1 Tax=Acytostelium subglobosum LB1 TaxID=1410327 RepID=UPI0006450562|nr:hypothetical protein SAMD00019534_018900 [Acytostelium subglobosum LB1]GAM18715.1 hypothetical protein SAMD00019534_018900 [Acytostelium subglobosum LB1]|eukprot:XP_012757935.1 hypothetical protein SAMD00019534_018900 [Acytostelium subglobosum LB1]
MYAQATLANEDQGSADTSKVVHLSMLSNWQSTPLYLEAFSFFKEKLDVDSYKQYIEEVNQRYVKKQAENGDTLLTDEESFQVIVDSSASILDSDQSQSQSYMTLFLKAVLALRTYSPRVEMLRQLYLQDLSNINNNDNDNNNDNNINNKRERTQVIVLGGVEGSFSAWAKSIDFTYHFADSINLEIPVRRPVVYQQDTIYAQNTLFKYDAQVLVPLQSVPVAVYYSDVTSATFAEVHRQLKKLAEGGKIIYALRFVVPSSKRKAHIQGYGYSLSIKNLEYKVMDDSVIEKDELQSQLAATAQNEDISGFNFKVLHTRHPELSSKLSTFRKYLLANQQTTELKVWQVKDLGVQAAQKIVGSSDPIRSLSYISSTFPSLQASLARISLNETLKQQIEAIHKHVTEGENQLFLNDRVIQVGDSVEDEFELNPLGLTDIVLDEVKFGAQLQQIGLSNDQILNVNKLILKPSSIRFDMLPDDQSIILYMNNLNSDYTYQRWDKSFSALSGNLDSSSVYFGKNLFTALFVLDMGSEEVFTQLAMVSSLINNNSPCRFGIIFNTESLPTDKKPPSDLVRPEVVARLFWTFKERMGHRAAFFFMNALNYFRSVYEADYNSYGIVQSAFQTVIGQMGNRMPNLIGLMESTELAPQLIGASQYINAKGITQFPQLFINGMLVEISEKRPLLDAVHSFCMDELHVIKALWQEDVLNDNTDDIYKTIMENFRTKGQLLSSFNPTVIPSSQSTVKLPGDIFGSKAAERVYQSLVWHLASGRDASAIDKVSVIVVADFNTAPGVKAALSALNSVFHSESNTQARYAMLPLADSPVSRVLAHPQIKTQSAIDLLNKQLNKLESDQTLSLEQALAAAGLSNDNDMTQRIGDQLQYVNSGLDLHSGVEKTYLLANGRLIAIDDNDLFNDFAYLERFESSRVEGAVAALGDATITSDLLMRVVSALASKMQSNAQHKELPTQMVPSFVYNPATTGARQLPLRFKMVVNPLSKTAQKMIPIVAELSRHFGIPCDVFLNVQLSLSELPLKTYYSYVVNLDTKFSATGASISEPAGTLVNLPDKKVLTLAIDVPSSWIVKPIIAKYDLDNIRLKDLGQEQVMRAVYELEHLLVQGHAVDVKDKSSLSGMELKLVPSKKQQQVETPEIDTIIMGSIGYFQLQGNPGVWYLETMGRGNQIMDILDMVTLKDKADHVIPRRLIIADSFKGSPIYLGVQHKPGKQHEPILPPVSNDDTGAVAEQQEEESTGFLSSLWGGGAKKKQPQVKASNNGTLDTIHVFSVASGHLYERFLKIMMLSVKKNTQNPVKFWFLKNYLSPKFVDFIPHYAEKYGFEYELVTYKWPYFLRQQTEKQRIIWAYKILFLDVLFPLSVKKIIFVDADQVVRTDLRELWDMDLQGASLGYTPFCDSNRETEGFRFWKKGFWHDHLRGRPYHISALYVVDLQRFRRIMAGDHMRMTYEQLSRDPNSLANLDQDLPNYLQHTVRIFSLPQEWLWCETWCSQESKTKAKTIDLCNNPMTKTPKLENAVRIIGEWTDLDNEAKRAEQDYNEQQQQQQQQQQQRVISQTTAGDQHQHHQQTVDQTTPDVELAQNALEEAQTYFN